MTFKGPFYFKPPPAYPKFPGAGGFLPGANTLTFSSCRSIFPRTRVPSSRTSSFGEEGQGPAAPLLAPTSPSHLSIPVGILVLLTLSQG